MKNLCFLNTVYLDGNPLSYHRKHRLLTIESVHPQAVTTKFQLDGKKLSRTEMNVMKQNTVAFNEAFKINLNQANSINTHPEDLRSTVHLGHQRHQRQGSTSSSSRSSDVADEFTASISSTGSFASKRRRHKAREVEISDEIDANGDGDGLGADKSKHLQTKEQIESNRKQFGSSWLVINTRLASPKSPCLVRANLTIPVSNTPPRTELNETFGLGNTSVEQQEVKSNVNHEQNITSDAIPSVPSDDIIVLHKESGVNTVTVEVDVHERSVYSPEVDAAANFDFVDETAKIFSDEEVESATTFIVQLIRNSDTATLFISVDDDYIREKDGFTGRTVECLDLRSLLSIEKQVTPPHCVRLFFDYIRKDRRERQYVLEDESNCKLFLQLLQPILDKRILDEMTVGALQCLACGAEFSKNGVKLKLQTSKKPVHGQPSTNMTKDYLQEISVCPNCESDMIVELDEAPLPQSTQQTNAETKESSLNLAIAKSVHSKPKMPKLPLKHSTPTIFPVTTRSMEPSTIDAVVKPETLTSPRQSQSVVMDLQQNRGRMEHMVRNELFGRSCEERSPRRASSFSKMEGTSRSLSVSPVSRDDTIDHSVEPLPFTERTDNTVQASESSGFVTAECHSRETSLSRSSTPPKVCLRDSDSHSDNSEGSAKHQLLPGSTTSLKRSDSDITILSNPSQSSISVLSTPSGDLGSVLEAVADAHRKSSMPLPPSSDYLSLASNFPRERSQSLIEDINQAVFEPEVVSESKARLIVAHDSSSSGSIASSVCTTYERSIYDDSNHRSPGSQSSNGFSAGRMSSECVMEGAPTSDSSEYFTANSSRLLESGSETNTPQVKQVRSEPNLLQSDDLEEPSFKSVSSSSVALKNSPDEVTVVSSAKLMGDGLRQVIRYSYDNFTQVDHRIRLHMDVNVFEDGEEFRSILKMNMMKCGKPGEFSSLLIMSSKNFYIFKIIGEEGNEPKKWLQKVDVRPVSHLKSICVHFGKQGFTLAFVTQNNSVSYLFLLRDMIRCSKYITYISGWVADVTASGLASPVITFNDELYNSLLLSVLSPELQLPGQENVLLYVMGYFWTSSKDGRPLLEPTSFVVSSVNMYLVRENLQWCLSQTDAAPSLTNTPFVLLQQEAIHNLNEVKMASSAPTEAKFCFADEDSGAETDLHVTMETEFSRHALLSAIKTPWEALYCVDLRISIVDSL